MEERELGLDFGDLVPLIDEQGETEADLDIVEAGQFDAAISSTDWTVETLISQMRKGRIDLNPHFQRRNAWTVPRKSQLVESVMLRYPIPQLVLAERPGAPGHYFVIDGKQRLLALRQFTADPTSITDHGFDTYRLKGMEILKDLGGLSWLEVQERHPGIAATFENHTVRTVLIAKWHSEDLLLSLFLRLNTGSVKLSAQELRQALHPGPFTTWVDMASGESLAFRALLGSDEPDRRMVDAELLLRHLALRFSPHPYTGNLKKFLDDTSGSMNKDWTEWQHTVQTGLHQLELAIQAAREIFSADGACRRWANGKWERQFNRAIFDVQIFALSQPEVRYAMVERAEAISESFKILCTEDQDFAQAVTSTTKSLTAFRARFEAFHNLVMQQTDKWFELPQALYGARGE